jgi:hypothetical protein
VPPRMPADIHDLTAAALHHGWRLQTSSTRTARVWWARTDAGAVVTLEDEARVRGWIAAGCPAALTPIELWALRELEAA